MRGVQIEMICMGLVLGLSAAGSAAADDFGTEHQPATCSYVEAGPPGPAGNELLVFVPGSSDLSVRQAAAGIEVVDHPEPRKDVLVSCTGGNATIADIDTIRVQVTTFTATAQHVSFEYPNGPPGPGATPETDGQSEIETRIDGYGAQIDLRGGPGSDRWEVQGSDGVIRAILSSDSDRSDFDLVGDVPLLDVFGGPGDDQIAIPGGEAFEHSSVHGGAGNDLLSGRSAALFGEAGRDRLKNGSFTAWLKGGRGNDHVIGGSSRDFISGGSGRDVLLGLGGVDLIKSPGGGRDRVDCGGGVDQAVTDRRDKVRRCENVGPPARK